MAKARECELAGRVQAHPLARTVFKLFIRPLFHGLNVGAAIQKKTPGFGPGVEIERNCLASPCNGRSRSDLVESAFAVFGDVEAFTFALLVDTQADRVLADEASDIAHNT